ncbi:MAG: phosphoribosylformylglycinamidine cyclo-ligase, partial [Dehalococcoidales bacterium]
VNIDAAARIKEIIARYAAATTRPEVLAGPGLFGGLFELGKYRQPVLVSSVDGVGTKLKIAAALGKHDTIGIDLVNHCVNDILTGGAAPLFFLDYIAAGKLNPEQVGEIARGLAEACRQAGCALIGGETAEMPGLYSGEDYDLAGFIVGVVEKDRMITGKTIATGDVILGLPSSGLHTNGYSLVRKIFGTNRQALGKHYPELGRSLGDELLEPHRSYHLQLEPLLSYIKGMAHITGGGLIDNLPRILPPGTAARLKAGAWPVPAIFNLIREKGAVTPREMYRIFNMGIGMAVIAAADDAEKIGQALPEAIAIGRVVEQKGEDRVIIAGAE